MSSFTIDGIVSGFDTTSVIESLLGFQQNQVDTFNSRKAEITTQQSAFKGIEAQVLTLKGTLARLNRTTNSVFDVQSATSSNESIVNVAASSGATSGNYNLKVVSLAAAHQIGSQGYESAASILGTGEISFRVGDGETSTVTLSEDNNTLAGLVNEINEQVSDVNAGIVRDQSTGDFRLLLTSTKTGAANEISVTSNLTGGESPDFSGDPVQPAADALITLGSGPGAITAQYETNQIDDLIENVTLNLESADADTVVNIRVEEDSEPAKTAISDFVSDFNSIIDFIEDQSQFNPDTNQSSPLTGNRSASSIKNELLETVTGNVAGLTDGLSRLSQIGVDVDNRGRLTIDEVKLDKAFNGELQGVDPKEIRNLFGLNGSSSNSGIEYLSGSTRTLPSNTPYDVDITQAAERGTISATNALASSVTIDDSNNQLQITINGVVSEFLTLENGTYTDEELAAEVQSQINNSSDLGVNDVEVSVGDSGELVITSELYGSQSRVASVSGSSATTLGFTGTEADSGQDVAGSFYVNGVQELASGNGRTLISDSENANTADLQVIVRLTSDQLGAGNEGQVTITQGVSSGLDSFLGNLLDSETGLLANVDEDFEARIQSIDDSIERVEQITESKRESLIAEFTALETILNDLQTTGSFISSQLQSLSAFGNDKK